MNEIMPREETTLLERLGWDAYFSEHFELLKVPSSVPARVAEQQRQAYQVFTELQAFPAEISGRLRLKAESDGYFPAVGDWVVFTTLPNESRGIIHAVLPRKSQFVRQASGGRGRQLGGRTSQQVVGANVDTVFIVGALDGGRSINARRFERYLALAWNSGASPVVVLNKADLCRDVDSCIRDIDSVAASVPVLVVSATERTGLDALSQYLSSGRTAAFLGSSGVGKSALINALLGEERQEVREVRERDMTGRHTTSVRELLLLPGGGAVIDTPGMREIQMWAEEDDLASAFGDIESLAERCRFKDCAHDSEPGCAVKAAIDNGELDRARLESFRKLEREVQFHEARQEGNARRLEKERWKKISQWQKDIRREE